MSERGQRALDMCQWDRECMMIHLRGLWKLEERLEEIGIK